MSLLLDHIVILVKDLEQTIADFDALGFTVQRGGTHADGATHNALIGFQDGSYFELIAFLRNAPRHRWWDAGERVGEGLVNFALLPQSVPATVDAAHGRGLRYDGPNDGGRIRPDGKRLEWQTAKPPTPDLPFLCGDVTPRDLRVVRGDVRKHQNGALGVASLTVAVHDLDASVARYRALFGEALAVHAGTLTGHGVSFASLHAGESTVVLLASNGAAQLADHNMAQNTLAHDLNRRLSTRGEGVFGVTLRTGHHAVPQALPLKLTHGAPLELATTP